MSSDEYLLSSSEDFDDDSDEFIPSKLKGKAPSKPAAPKTTKKPAATTSKTTAKTATKSTKAGTSSSSGSSKSSTQSKLAFPDPSDSESEAPAKVARSSKEVDVGSKYRKVSQLEHVLLRPDTYVGSIEKTVSSMWIWENDHMNRRDIEWVPGLYKIFDEILVNAADCAVNDPDCDTIKVTIDGPGNRITVWNNGKGIPVAIHPTEKIYVPEMIFGHLLTSSNYNDKEEKVTGGRNGFGAKLANIFSTEFTVETVDVGTKKKYFQRFSGNMGRADPASISTATIKSGYTQISFKPDLARFGLETLSDDMIALMRKRTYDIAGTGTANLKVYLNGTRLPIKSFKNYVELYTNSPCGAAAMGAPLLYEKIHDRWEIAITRSDGSQFEQVSFVNSISTPRGGSHVDHVVAPLIKYLGEAAKKKTKTPIRPQHIKLHLFVFVKCLIVNPAFDSQCKETLTSKVANFGSRCNLDDAFFKKMNKLGIIDAIVATVNNKADAQLAKQGGAKKSRLTGFTKLDDANDAGTRKADQCTLILTEGDSAKTLAISGLAVVGRDSYGVFPLRGKLLNARDAPSKSVADNAELKALTQILGLHYGKRYDTPEQLKSLRYGSILIMTDQDVDGSHIKGLVINWIHAYWPQLIKRNGFVCEFITPIVKVKKGTKSLSFYTLPEYLNWKVANNGAKGWHIKYYKGLGTSTPAEAREYFGDLNRHLIQFKYSGPEDDKRIDMAFSKKDKAADERKIWLRGYTQGTYLDQNVSHVSYSDFIDKELILFSHADCVRSIPHLVDGFKPGQRKVLYGCFKKKLHSEVKVAQLSGYIGEHAAYHHGELSLQDTIVKMAQTFVGSNNLALLFPAGMFGSRLMGGKDHASARYINTRLSKIARAIFHEADDHLLTYLDDDGFAIEPEYYVPIIPMVLVNGAEGIGTGWSTSIPNYSPYDLIDALRSKIAGEEPKELHPYYRGFYGAIEIQPNEPGIYLLRGCWDLIDDDELISIRIWELPVRLWTNKFKKTLEDCIEKNQISNYREYHTESKVYFSVQFTPEQWKTINGIGVEKFFKLHSRVSVNNMHLYNADEAQVARYQSARQILDSYFPLRMTFYARRKEYLVAQLTEEVSRLENKCRFIRMVISGELEIRNKAKRDIVMLLQKNKFKVFGESIASRKTVREGNTDQLMTTYEGPEGGAQAEDEDDEQDGGAETSNPPEISQLITGFDYLLSMKLWSLSKESVQKLESQVAERTRELRVLLSTSPSQMWLNDLLHLETLLDTVEMDEYNKAIAVGAASTSSGPAKRDRAKAAPSRRAVKSVLPPHPADDLPFMKRAQVTVGQLGAAGITLERKPRSLVRRKSEPSLNDSLKVEGDSSLLDLSSSTPSSSSSSTSAPSKPASGPMDKFLSASESKPPTVSASKKAADSKTTATTAAKKTATAAPVKKEPPPKRTQAKKKTQLLLSDDDDISSDDFEDDSDGWQPSPKKPSRAPRPTAASGGVKAAPKAQPSKPSMTLLLSSEDDVRPSSSSKPATLPSKTEPAKPVAIQKSVQPAPTKQAAAPSRAPRAAAVKATQNFVVDDGEDSLSEPSPLSDFDF